jgi:uncharacterized protein DUF1524
VSSRTVRVAFLAAVAALALLALAGGPATSVAQTATCDDFANQADAQEAANTSDPDHDGIYCESLPCPCSAEWHAQHDPDGGGPTPDSDPDPVEGRVTAPEPGSVDSRVSPLRDPRGLHPGLKRVPRTKLTKARRLIRKVRTALAGSGTGYSRERFGAAWTDTATKIAWAGNGCDTRNDILRRDLTPLRFVANTDRCVVRAGRLRNPYMGDTIRFRKRHATRVPIDHVFPLSLAWQMGAARWSAAKRVQLANDPLNLLAVDLSSNSRKGDSGPADWLPANTPIRCAYSVRLAQVARKYDLPVTKRDKGTMRGQCAREQ